MPLFTVKIEIEGDPHEIEYETIDQFLGDVGLKALFETHLVSACAVFCGDRRITSIPFMEWGRLKEQIVHHSSNILKQAGV